MSTWPAISTDAPGPAIDEPTTHTPGPWIANSTRWPEQVGCCPLTGRPYGIAHKHLNVAAAKTLADARLIAAAPDLLAVLRLARAQLASYLQELVQSEIGQDGQVHDPDALLVIESEQDLINQIDAAIVKAEGESQ